VEFAGIFTAWPAERVGFAKLEEPSYCESNLPNLLAKLPAWPAEHAGLAVPSKPSYFCKASLSTTGKLKRAKLSVVVQSPCGLYRDRPLGAEKAWCV
jgi:hypothetical protein